MSWTWPFSTFSLIEILLIKEMKTNLTSFWREWVKKMKKNLGFTSPLWKGMTIQPRINQKGARTCWLLFLVVHRARGVASKVKILWEGHKIWRKKIFLLDLTFTKIPKTSHSDVVNFFETDSELALGKALIFKNQSFWFFRHSLQSLQNN